MESLAEPLAEIFAGVGRAHQKTIGVRHLAYGRGWRVASSRGRGRRNRQLPGTSEGAPTGRILITLSGGIRGCWCLGGDGDSAIGQEGKARAAPAGDRIHGLVARKTCGPLERQGDAVIKRSLF
jgi:hypothetical protein